MPRGSTSSSIEKSLDFWIDETAKTVVLADGTPLTVRRFDDRWISDMSYEFTATRFLTPFWTFSKARTSI